jgi:hypothetical protein
LPKKCGNIRGKGIRLGLISVSLSETRKIYAIYTKRTKRNPYVRSKYFDKDIAKRKISLVVVYKLHVRFFFSQTNSRLSNQNIAKQEAFVNTHPDVDD